MMGILILIAYLVGFLLTWIVAYAMTYRSFIEHVSSDSPIEDILMSGGLSFILAMFWPIIIAIFGIHRITTRHTTTTKEEQ